MTHSNDQREVVEVIQADREAAAEQDEHSPYEIVRVQAEQARAGLLDRGQLVQAFARHRQQHASPAPVEAGEAERLREVLLVTRGSIGDLRKGFAQSVEPARWVEQVVAYIDAALSPASPPRSLETDNG